MERIALTVNGIGREVDDEPRRLLVQVLREDLGLRAEWLPAFELDETVTPSPTNPLGVKGAGEAGTIASTAAVANAVNDALAPFGIRHLDIPLSAARIWAAMQAAGRSANGKEAQA